MRFILTIIGIAMSSIAWWLYGFNFDTRGSDALQWFVTSTGAGIIGYLIG